ncbi:hypothetical protein TUN199_11293 [Pyrenophora tritici-repentis]|nr:hypothetical protein Alg130_11311 [Pyrenophora tritici-repentis]KAI0604054.1 hypothetical protein TUN205_11699 [Pyrenophora tritici-repentis]KAI0616713.1 hypothetical protein TUN199_11293 [Pyrenophora tritici-repentis]
MDNHSARERSKGIVNHIARYVASDSYHELSLLATLSRAWQEAIESITFRKLKVKSDELHTFQQFVTRRRRHHLADLKFEMMLPTYTKKQTQYWDTPTQKRSNNACFTLAIRELFKILKNWEDENVQRHMRLRLKKVFSPTPCLMQPMALTRITLTNPDSLPTLSRVRELDLQHPYPFPNMKLVSPTLISPQVAPWLLKLLPNTNRTVWNLVEFRDGSEKIAFAEAIKATQLQPRSELIMNLRTYQGISNLVLLPHDLLSAAIRTVSQNLTVMTLKFKFDATLFWPSNSKNSGTPYWPHLKELRVESTLYQLYVGSEFYRMESEDSDEHDYSGNQMLRVTEHPVLITLAKAVQNMPLLEYFYFLHRSEQLLGGAHTGLPGFGTFAILYHCPGPWNDYDHIEETKEEESFRRICCSCEHGNTWRPEEETVVALRNAGEKKFGGKPIEGSRLIGRPRSILSE